MEISFTNPVTAWKVLISHRRIHATAARWNMIWTGKCDLGKLIIIANGIHTLVFILVTVLSPITAMQIRTVLTCMRIYFSEVHSNSMQIRFAGTFELRKYKGKKGLRGCRFCPKPFHEKRIVRQCPNRAEFLDHLTKIQTPAILIQNCTTEIFEKNWEEPHQVSPIACKNIRGCSIPKPTLRGWKDLACENER
jgi:hypothetical protein